MNGPTPTPEFEPARAAVANAEAADWDNTTDVDLDAPLPFAVTPAGEAALLEHAGAPRAFGVALTPELLDGLSVVVRAHDVARATRPGLSLGDFVAEVRRQVAW